MLFRSAGDAAHLLPIFGVRGANTGFQDAHNLGWKLAAVARGVAPRALLESYSSERVGAAREIIAEAGKSTRFMTPPSQGFRLLRDAVLSLSLSEPFVAPLFHWRTSRPHVHEHSPLNAPGDDNALFTSGPAAGAPLPNARLGADDFLLDHVGGGFCLLRAVAGDALSAPLQAALQAWRARGVALSVLALSPHAQPVPGADRTLHDPDGAIAARLGLQRPGASLLVRPDQHVCARWLSLDPGRLDAALQRALAL